MPFDSKSQPRAVVKSKKNRIVIYCKSQAVPCPHPVKIGEIAGQDLFGCPKIIKQLNRGEKQEVKISNYATEVQKQHLDKKTVKGFYKCLATILDMIDEDAPEVTNKVVLKLIGLAKITDTLSQGQKVDPKQLRNLKYGAEVKLKKITESGSRASRAVQSQKRIDDYIYKQQKSPRGGLYWYLLELKDKKNKLYYLGKEEPKFVPEEDLRALQERRTKKQKHI